MRYRRLGRSGLLVSVLGLGTNSFGGRLDLSAAGPVVDAALEAGVTFIDTADCYGDKGGRGYKGAAEECVGEVLKGRRADVVLATKFGRDMGGAYGPELGGRASRWYVQQAVEGSLRRLQTEWIDLYQLHRPDGITPFEETLEALDGLIRQGKVRYVGSSNLAAWQVVQADWIGRCHRSARFISAQNHYSLLERSVETELVPACLTHDVSLLAYYPLASGLLTGRWAANPATASLPPAIGSWSAKYGSPAMFETIGALSRFASQRAISLLDVAIGGLAAQPAVASVIAGATTAQQLRANVAAAQWEPTQLDLTELDRITASGRQPVSPLLN